MSNTEYIHGTAPSEQARLAALNRLTNSAFIEFLRPSAGMRVLDVGSGLGILAAEVATAAAGIQVVGLERSPEQIAAATRSESVTYVQGDAHQIPLPGESFDLVYARYLLEHVGNPAGVLAEMRRVLRPGGRIALMENDISLIRLDPPCPDFEEVWSALAHYQRQVGGDALIGRRLFRLLKEAGFRHIELSFQPEIHWSGSPEFRPWLENLIGNLASARQGLIAARLADADHIDRAEQELRELAERDDGSALFTWNRAAAVR
jgi:ubiquinone/menaquinone biosynthesis C-methylase UbiE